MKTRLSASLIDAIERAIIAYDTKLIRGEPASDRVLAAQISLEIENFFAARIGSLIHDPDEEMLKMLSRAWEKLTGERK